MKILKKMLLINWHYFWNEIIEFEDINFLTGRNAAGKSTMIDALQLVLLGDTSGHFFNKAANDKSTRTLKGYLYGEVGEDGDVNIQYLRKGRFTSFIACEFHDSIKNKDFTLGIVFDCYDDGSFEHRFFCLDATIPENRFIIDKKPMSLKQLRSFAHNNYNRSRFDFPETNRGYQELLKGKLGGLKNKYFSLLKKAVPFSPIKDIEVFITEYVCDVKGVIDISMMQDNIRYYKRLEQDAGVIEKRVNALQDISDKYKLWQEEKQRLEMQTYIIERAEHQKSLDRLENLQEQNRIKKKELADTETQQKKYDNEINEFRIEKEKLTRDKVSSDIYKKKDELDNRKEQLALEIERIKADLEKNTKNLRKYGLVWRDNARQFKDLSDLNFLNYAQLSAKSLPEKWNWLCALCDQVVSYAEKLIDADLENISNPGTDGFKEVRNCITCFKGNAQEVRYYFVQAQEDAHRKLKESEALLESMKQGIKPYDAKLIGLRDAIAGGLTKIHGKNIEVHILADLLEVKDSRWSKAIEGYLHTQKFYLLVEPEYFVDALKIYDQLKFAQGFYDWGLIDSEKLLKRNPQQKRGSLAEEVSAENTYARLFVDYVMGSVIKCDRVEDLRNYDRAITDSGMLYQNYVARQLNPERWKAPYIGRKAVDEQIRIKKEEISRVTELLQIYRKPLAALKNITDMEAMNANEVEIIQRSMDSASGLPQLESDYRSILKQLGELDLTWLMGLDAKIKELEVEIGLMEQKNKDLNEKMGELKEIIKGIEKEKIPGEQSSIKAKQDKINALFQRDWIDEYGEPRFLKELEARRSAEQVYTAFYAQVARTRNQTEKKKEDLAAVRSNYNRDYKMSYDINLPHNAPYEKELGELREVKLPEYLQKIQDAREKASEQFRDDFLAKLKSNIDTVKNQIEELNGALKESSWGRDRYRFVVTPKAEYRRYYDMITDEMLLEGYNIASQLFRDKHKDAIDELFKRIVDVDFEMDAETRAEIEKNIKRFTDYRTYLKFDLIVTDEEDRNQRLSRTLNKKSGGETQTPFYISVLASFAQLYRVRHKNESGNTMRLIIFDEAFSKMDSERIQESIKLLRRFGLQAILSAPPEKIGDIAPLVDRNLCVFRSGDRSYVKAFDSKKLIEEELIEEN
ncbi:MAG: ATP-binding protein [Bacillota bacterium]|jgi:uncharacterized protein YPO0396